MQPGLKNLISRIDKEQESDGIFVQDVGPRYAAQ